MQNERLHRARPFIVDASHPPSMKSAGLRARRGVRWGLALVSCFASLAGAAEPTYEGRGLGDWLADLSNTPAGLGYEPAARAFRAMGTNAVPFLLTRLEADRPAKLGGEAALVVNAFREIGAPASNAIPRLSELLLKESSSGSAAAALVAIHAEAPVVALLSRPNSPNSRMRRNALIALASSSVGPAAVPPLIGLLGDPDNETRHLTAWVLGQVRKEEALTVRALTRATEDPDSWVRHNAVASLGNFESQAAVVSPVLLRALTDTNAHVRGSAARSLGGMMNRLDSPDRKKIVGALIQALKDREEDVRYLAAWALGTPLPETREAFGPLLELTKTSSQTLSNAAAAALRHIDREAALKAGIN